MCIFVLFFVRQMHVICVHDTEVSDCADMHTNTSRYTHIDGEYRTCGCRWERGAHGGYSCYPQADIVHPVYIQGFYVSFGDRTVIDVRCGVTIT